MSLYYAKGLLTGGVGSVATVGTGVTGWKLHQETSMTVDQVLRKMGYEFSHIKPSEAIHKPIASQKFDWRPWSCFNRLFPNTTVNQELESNSTDSSGAVPTVNLESTQHANAGTAMGCLDMKMYPWKDAGDAARLYMQMELALRKGEMGVVLWTAMSQGKLEGSSDSALSFDFYHRMILLKKESGQWQVKGGYEWVDGSLMIEFNETGNFLTVKTPDGTYWTNQQLISNWSQSHQWTGIWREGPAGNHPLKDIDFQMGSASDNKPFYEVYGLDEGFVVTNSEHTTQGYQSVSAYYDAGVSRWKSAGSSHTSKNKTETLKQWYKPFQDKKGQWTEIGKLCKPWTRSPRNNWRSVGWMKEVCFEKISSRS